MRDMKSLKLVIFAVLVVAVVLLFGVTNAWYQLTVDSANDITLTSGTLELTFLEGDEVINLDNAVPTSDLKGLSGSAYTFTIKNVGSIDSSYTLYLEDVLTSGIRMEDKYVKYSLSKNGSEDKVSLMSGLPTVNSESGNNTRVLTTGTLDVGDSVTYSLKVWMSEDADNDAMNTEFSAKVRMEATQKDKELEINNPITTNGMIPVTYNGKNWVKADVTNASNSWYDYNNQKWANAVTVYDSEKRKMYDEANVGTIMSDADINTFFVWIPRYSYTLSGEFGHKLGSALNPSKSYPGAFDIKFISTDTVETGTGSYTGSAITNYYTPLAFCFGDTCDTSRSDSNNVELPGIWVSKFELTGSLNDISSIPNAPSLRNIEVDKFFDSISKNMNNKNGVSNYGFSGNYDAHMIKNSEWSVISYLTQSKYGKYGNDDYSGTEKNVFMNTSTGYMTGNGDGATYNEVNKGVGASTTGNIYGVYDTNGGSSEYVMGNLNSLNGSAKFVAFPSRKYYDLYSNSDITVACNNSVCHSQNLNTTNGWYDSVNTFVSDTAPWLLRGGSSGIFGFNAGIGISKDASTRVSLVSW